MQVSGPHAPLDSLLCQIETAHEGARLRRTGFLYFASRLVQMFKSGGFKEAFETTVRPRVAAIHARFTRRQADSRPVSSVGEILNLARQSCLSATFSSRQPNLRF